MLTFLRKPSAFQETAEPSLKIAEAYNYLHPRPEVAFLSGQRSESQDSNFVTPLRRMSCRRELFCANTQGKYREFEY